MNIQMMQVMPDHKSADQQGHVQAPDEHAENAGAAALGLLPALA